MTGDGPRRPLRVGIVDHGAGNLVSLAQGLVAAGARPRLIHRPEELHGIDALVLPGVGAAGTAMRRLQRRRLTDALAAWRQAGRPLLGICLGLQLFMTRSEEDETETLGLVAGRTVRLTAPRLPHIGWNRLRFAGPPHRLFAGLSDGSHAYFVHSYVVQPAPGAATILAETTYGGPFPSAIAAGSLLGVQFHPERSGPLGIRVLANFVAWAGQGDNDAPSGRSETAVTAAALRGGRP